MSEPRVEGGTGCLYCPGQAEPEQEGSVAFYCCPACGGVFGYRPLPAGEELCAAGLPVREQAAPPAAGQSVFIGEIGRRPQ